MGSPNVVLMKGGVPPARMVAAVRAALQGRLTMPFQENDPAVAGGQVPQVPAGTPLRVDPQGVAVPPQPAVPVVVSTPPPPSANRMVAGGFGIAFLLLGALSFTALSDPKFIGDNGELLFGAFQVNGLLIIARIVLGLVLLLATRDTILGSARTNIGAGVATLLIAVSAPFIDQAVDGGLFALAQADYVVFAISAVALIAAGVFLDRRRNNAVAA